MENSQFDSLLDLKAGWDSYGAKPINPSAVAAAKNFLRMVQVVPTNKGGVQFEWHCYGVDVEVEFGPDGRIVKQS